MTSRSRRWTGLLTISLMFVSACAGTPAYSQNEQLARRLILKDGSYQSVTKYEVKGDRVRYLSAERNEWEELPSSMVDWPATEKYEKERAAAPTLPEAALIDKESAEDRKADELRRPEVAPGLRLPDSSGMFLLDNFKGQPQLVELQQDEGDVNHNSKGNILRGALIPVPGGKQTIELQGDHANVDSHVAVPSIYINVEDEDEAPPAGETSSAKPSQPSLDTPRQQPQQAQGAVIPFDRFRIVHVKVKSGKRTVGDIKRTSNGKFSQEEDFVKTTIDRVGSGWLKLTPVEELAPGEYAVLETRSPDAMNIFIWSFSVNPSGPANTNPWTPK